MGRISLKGQQCSLNGNENAGRYHLLKIYYQCQTKMQIRWSRTIFDEIQMSIKFSSKAANTLEFTLVVIKSEPTVFFIIISNIITIKQYVTHITKGKLHYTNHHNLHQRAGFTDL